MVKHTTAVVSLAKTIISKLSLGTYYKLHGDIKKRISVSNHLSIIYLPNPLTDIIITRSHKICPEL
jgi:hypothetical protein